MRQAEAKIEEEKQFVRNDIRNIQVEEYDPLKGKVDELRGRLGLEKLPTLEQEANQEMTKSGCLFCPCLEVV